MCIYFDNDEIYIYFSHKNFIYNSTCGFWCCNLKVEMVLAVLMFVPNLYSFSAWSCYHTLLKKM